MNNFPHGVIRPSAEGRPWFIGSNQMPSLIQREQQHQQLQDRILHEQKQLSHLQHKPRSQLPMPKQREEQHEMEVDLQHTSEHSEELHQQQPESRKQQLQERLRQHQLLLGQQYQVMSEQHQHQLLSERHQQQLLVERQQQHHLLSERQQQQQVLSEQQQHHQVLSERQQQNQVLPERQQRHQVLSEQQQQHQALPEQQKHPQVLSDRQEVPRAKLGAHHHPALGLPERGHGLSALDYLEDQPNQLRSEHRQELEQHGQPAVTQDHAKPIPGISETFRQIANQHGIAVTTSHSSLAQQLSTAVNAKSGPPNLIKQYRKSISSNMSSVVSANQLGVTGHPTTASPLYPFCREVSTAMNPVTTVASLNPFSREESANTLANTARHSVTVSMNSGSAAKQYDQTHAFAASHASVKKQHGTAVPPSLSSSELCGGKATSSDIHLDTALELSLRQGGFGEVDSNPKKSSAMQMSEYFPLPVPLASQSEKPKTETISEDPEYNCIQCGKGFTSALQLKYHHLDHFEESVQRTGGLQQKSIKREALDVSEKGHGAGQPASENSQSMKRSPGNVDPSLAEGETKSAAESSVDSKTWNESQMEVDLVDKMPAEGESNVSIPSKKLVKKPEKNHQCTVCAKRFSRLDHLRRHFRKCHAEVVKTEEPEGGTCTPHHLGLIRNNPPQMNTRKGDGPFQCFVCGKCFKRPDHMKRHISKTHPDFDPVETPRLPITMKFDVRSLYGQRSSSKRAKSSVPKLPTTPVYTEADVAEKRHVCITCDRRFKRQDHLKRHARIHTGEKPYSCLHCGKAFQREHHLQRHERTHTGEKPYECVTCGKKFSREDHMKKHYRSHIVGIIRKPGEKIEVSLE